MIITISKVFGKNSLIMFIYLYSLSLSFIRVDYTHISHEEILISLGFGV